MAYAIKEEPVDYVINYQGDEPFEYSEDIEKLYEALEKYTVATLTLREEKA